MTDYDTIHVPRAETRTITLGDGETLSNTLIDITAQGASVVIEAIGDDWTIRNVGIRGEHPGKTNVLKCGVTSADAAGTVENLYLGDGFVPGSKGGVYVVSQPAHRGTLTFDGIHVAHSSNNGLYASGPGYKGQPGIVHVRNSYFYSNNISNVRLGGPGGVSEVENVTIHVDDTVNGCDMNCSSPGAVNARGVWAWSGDVTLRDCDIQTNGHGNAIARRDGATVTRYNCRLGGDAETSAPAAAPMTAEAAANGDGATTAQPGFDHEVVIDGDGTETDYRLEVTGGRLEPSPADGATFNDVDDAITETDDGWVATGTVFGGTDAYRYDDADADLELYGPVERLELDGDELDPSEYRVDEDRGNGGGDATDATPPMTPNPDNWDLVFEDQFDGTSLDTDAWSIGFGWGRDTTASDERITDDNVQVDNGTLRLTAKHNGGPGSVTAGCINTKGKTPFGPGHYFECRLKAPHRYGWLPAFWSKPNDETWPPEIDFFEALGNDTDDSHHNIHYDASGGVGGNHAEHRLTYDGIGSTTDWHTYGCAWHDDRVEMYVDGEHVGTHDEQTAMQSLRRGAPFYMMLNIHVGKTGDPDYSEPWPEEMLVDYVRVYEYGANGSAAADYDHRLTVEGTGSYELTVSGDAANDPTTGSFDPEDDVADGTISGTVGGGTDGYHFNGELVDATVGAGVTVAVDGDELDLSEYRADENSGNDGAADGHPDDTDPDSDMADYTTITVPAGQTRRFNLSGGDTLENTLIDITARGASYRINCSGNGWTIRNVGVKGSFPTSGATEPFTVRGNGTIENLYLGDGDDGNATGIFAMRSHSGHIDLRNVNIQGWTDNGLYASAPGNGPEHKAPGGGGTLAVEDSYAAHNGIANFRLGTDGSYIKNSVMEGGRHRSYWGYYNDTKLIDCDITGAHLVVGENIYQTGRQASVTVENCRYDVNVSRASSSNRFHGTTQGRPDTTLPDGVPTSPEEAASGGGANTGRSGGSTGESGKTYDHTLTIRGAEELAEYAFRIDGDDADLVPHQTGGATFDPEDDISVPDASGTVWGGLDAYDFNGDLVALEVDGPATFELDGEEIDPADYPAVGDEDDESADDGPDWNVIAFYGNGNEATYEFTVDGDRLEPADNEPHWTFNPRDDIDGTTASGRIVGGVDAYRFTGSLTALSIDGDYDRATLNGDETSPGDYDSPGGGESDETDAGDGESGAGYDDAVRAAPIRDDSEGGLLAADGDGESHRVVLPHDHGGVPTHVAVMPASQAASSDHWLTDVTDTEVVVRYHDALPAGDGNLQFHVVTTE